MKQYRLLSLLILALSGCVTGTDIDAAFRRVDHAWQLDYQKSQDQFRFRVIDAGYEASFDAVRKTFIDLGLPVQSASLKEGTIVAENVAPAPLSQEEWIEVARVENPRAKEIGGWFLVIPEDPKNYWVKLKATLRFQGDKTFVLLDYALDSPKLRAMGVRPSRFAPPRAVQLGSIKFWSQLEKRLDEVKVGPPRRRGASEQWS